MPLGDIQVHLLKGQPLHPDRCALPSPYLLLSSSPILRRLHGGGGAVLAQSHLHQLQSGNDRPLFSFATCTASPPVLELSQLWPNLFLCSVPSLTPASSLPPLLHHLLPFQILSPHFLFASSSHLIFPFFWSISPCGSFLPLLLLFTQPFLPLMSHLPTRVCTGLDRQCLGWFLPTKRCVHTMQCFLV